MATESNLERKFTQKVRENGGYALKFASPSFNGMPDRIVLFPKGKVAFVEVKAPGEKPRPLQKARHHFLKKLGFDVYILDAEPQIPLIIDEIKKTESPI